MAERAGMKDLIDLVARLVNDQGHAAHGREDVQDALDVYREEWRYVALVGVPTQTVGGVTWLTFDADAPYWEADATFFDASFGPLTPSASDWSKGRWSFAAEPTAPVTIVGWNHDPYQAAADLLEVRAAQVAEAYDFKTGPDSFSRSQMHKQLLAQAARYRAMSPRLKAEAEAAAEMTMPEITFDVFSY